MVKQIIERLLTSRPIPIGTESKSTLTRVSQHLHMPTDLHHETTSRLIEERRRRPKISYSALICELIRKGLDK